MIRVRRIYSVVLPTERAQVAEVQAIFRRSFAAVAEFADKIPDLLNNPFQHGHLTILLVSETALQKVTGFALIFHFPEASCSLLEFLAVHPEIKSAGIGSALYQATRDYVYKMGSRALYLEVLPDDPQQVRDPEILEENRRRIRFYERYGARVIMNTAYETPLLHGPAPHLMFDGLGRATPLGRAECRNAVQAILLRAYGQVATPEYIHRVVNSIRDDPVRLRGPRYARAPERVEPAASRWLQKTFALTVSERHLIHHVREQGYVERPARVTALTKALRATQLFNEVPVWSHGEAPIRAVHDADFVNYLKVVCQTLELKHPVYPYVFPIRNPHRRPKELAVSAGYYCIDTFTPLDRNAYVAARSAVQVAVTGAEEILRGRRVAYALCRPPGHHAGRRTFGGFCYFNNAAIAAHWLSRHGKVAVLDLDFHHGNGTQDIFWRRDDVLTQSIHGHPKYAYPYFSGFNDEIGEGPGRGFNRNYPLQEHSGEEVYLPVLEKAVERMRRFRPAFLVVPIGFDTMGGDATGSFTLNSGSMRKIGQMLGSLQWPMLVVQEGGYSLRNLRSGAVAFFDGIARSLARPAFLSALRKRAGATPRVARDVIPPSPRPARR